MTRDEAEIKAKERIGGGLGDLQAVTDQILKEQEQDKEGE